MGPTPAKGKLEHRGVFPTADRLVVAATYADRLEAERLVQADRGGVRGPHFEVCLVRAACGGADKQVLEHRASDAAAAPALADAQIEHVRLAGSGAHDAVACELLPDQHDA